jgi:hypothetical protein
MIILNENIITTCNNLREEEIIKNYLNDGFQMISGNSDMAFICVIPVGIISGIYLLYKLLYSDERFSRESKCSSSIDIESLIKGGLVFKNGYDCDYCCCGDKCSCCCDHNNPIYREQEEQAEAAAAAAATAERVAREAREAEEKERKRIQERTEAEVLEDLEK